MLYLDVEPVQPLSAFPIEAYAPAGQPYPAQVRVLGGLAPFTWTLSSGSLPPGLTLNGKTGLISGVPTANGNYLAGIMITDSAVPADTATISAIFEFPGGG
jgi:hypothetical protein